MEEFTIIKVGEPFTLFNRGAKRDGSYFEALEDNEGFMMVTYLGGISPDEKELIENAKIRTRVYREGNKVFFLNRYGDSPLIFEVGFDPTLYDDRRAMQITFENHMVTFILVESFTNRIEAMRMANFPLKLKQVLITAWTSAFDEKNYSQNYDKWLRSFYAYDVMELWNAGEDIGEFGEVAYYG